MPRHNKKTRVDKSQQDGYETDDPTSTYCRKRPKKVAAADGDEFDDDDKDDDDEGGGGGDPAIDGDDFEPCGIDESGTGYCFLCEYTSVDQPDAGVRDKMMELERRVTRSVNTGLAQKTEDVFAMYEQMIRPRMYKRGHPVWSKESIRAHIRGSHGTAQVSLLQRRHTEYMSVLMEKVRENMMQRSRLDSAKTRLDAKMVRIYRDLGQHVMRDFKTDPSAS